MSTNTSWRNYALLILILLSIISIFIINPIQQDLAYHLFSDTRKLFGIKNFFDVASSLPFLLVGLIGLKDVISHWHSNKSWTWLILFSSVCLVSIGSAYYHLNPSNETLVWDRLPMAVGFMSLFVLVIGDYINIKIQNILLVPMCLLGIFSVLYWQSTDDLRIYIWVQFASMTLILVILCLHTPNTFQTKYLVYALIFYLLSKLTEYFDNEIFNYLSMTISGHTIKHLLSAIGTFYFYMLMKNPST